MPLPLPERRYYMDDVQAQYYAAVAMSRSNASKSSGEGGGGTIARRLRERREVRVQPGRPSNAVLTRMPGGRVILADTPQGFAGGRYSPPPRPRTIANPNTPFKALKQRGEALDEYYKNPLRKQARQWEGADDFFRTHPNYGAQSQSTRKVIDTEATKERLKEWYGKLPPWAKSAIRDIYGRIMSDDNITWEEWQQFKAEAQVYLSQGANALNVSLPDAVVKDMGMVPESEVPEEHAYQYAGNIGSKYTDTGFHGLEEEWLLQKTMASDPLTQLGMKVGELEEWAATQENPALGFLGGMAAGASAFGLGVLEGITAPVRPSTWWGAYKLVTSPHETFEGMKNEFMEHPVSFTGRFVGSMVGAKFLTDWVRLNIGGATIRKFVPEKTEFTKTPLDDRTVMYELRQLGRMKTVYRGPAVKGPQIAEGYQAGSNAGVVIKEYLTPATGEPVLSRFGGRIYVVKPDKIYDAVIRGGKKGIYFAGRKMGKGYSAFAQYELSPIRWSWGSWFRRARIVVQVSDKIETAGKGGGLSGASSDVVSGGGTLQQLLNNMVEGLPPDVAPDVVVSTPSSPSPGFSVPITTLVSTQREVSESKSKSEGVSDVSVDVEPVTRSAPVINTVNVNAVKARSATKTREWVSGVFSFEPVTRVRSAPEVSITPGPASRGASVEEVITTPSEDVEVPTVTDLRDEFAFDIVPRVRGKPPADIYFPRVKPRLKEVVSPKPKSRPKPVTRTWPDIDVRPDEGMGMRVREVAVPRLSFRAPPKPRPPKSEAPRDTVAFGNGALVFPSGRPKRRPRKRKGKRKYEERVNPFGLPFTAGLPEDFLGV